MVEEALWSTRSSSQPALPTIARRVPDIILRSIAPRGSRILSFKQIGRGSPTNGKISVRDSLVDDGWVFTIPDVYRWPRETELIRKKDYVRVRVKSLLSLERLRSYLGWALSYSHENDIYLTPSIAPQVQYHIQYQM